MEEKVNEKCFDVYKLNFAYKNKIYIAFKIIDNKDNI